MWGSLTHPLSIPFPHWLLSLAAGRTREDTVRQIVAGLTGDAEGSGDLANELSKADPVTLENGQESDDDISEPGDWVPDPVDADPGEMPSSALLAAAWFPWWAVALSSSLAAPLELGWGRSLLI